MADYFKLKSKITGSETETYTPKSTSKKLDYFSLKKKLLPTIESSRATDIKLSEERKKREEEAAIAATKREKVAAAEEAIRQSVKQGAAPVTFKDVWGGLKGATQKVFETLGRPLISSSVKEREATALNNAKEADRRAREIMKIQDAAKANPSAREALMAQANQKRQELNQFVVESIKAAAPETSKEILKKRREESAKKAFSSLNLGKIPGFERKFSEQELKNAQKTKGFFGDLVQRIKSVPSHAAETYVGMVDLLQAGISGALRLAGKSDYANEYDKKYREQSVLNRIRDFGTPKTPEEELAFRELDVLDILTGISGAKAPQAISKIKGEAVLGAAIKLAEEGASKATIATKVSKILKTPDDELIKIAKADKTAKQLAEKEAKTALKVEPKPEVKPTKEFPSLKPEDISAPAKTTKEKIVRVYKEAIANEDLNYPGAKFVENGKLKQSVVDGRVKDVSQKLSELGVDPEPFKKAIDGKTFTDYYDFSKKSREAMTTILKEEKGIAMVKKTKSPIIERLNKNLDEAAKLDENLSTTTHKEQLAKVEKELLENPRKVYSDAVFGGGEMSDSLRTTKLTALLENAKEKGDTKAMAEIGRALAFHGRKSGQEIEMIKAMIGDNPTNKSLVELAKNKLKSVAARFKKLKSVSKEGEDVSDTATRIVKDKVKQILKKERALKVENARNLIKSLTC